MRKIGLLLGLFFVLSSLISAASIKEDHFDFLLQGKNVQLTRETVFSESVSRTIDLGLPEDASQVSLWIDDQSVPVSNPLTLKEASKIKLIYSTEDFLDANDFFVNMNTLETVEHLQVSLSLSEGYELKLPVNEYLGSGSVYPKPSGITSDGQRIKITWNREDFKPEDEFSILVVFKEKINWWLWGGVVAALLILVGIALSRSQSHKKTQERPVHETSIEKREEVKKDLDISEHLKEEEKQVIQILKNKEGFCEQGTIRFIGNFSKAKLSRVLSELEARNVIYKEIKGNKNLIHLKKDY